MHMLLLAMSTTLYIAVHAMQEQSNSSFGFFLHNATQEHASFYDNANEKSPSIITIAPSQIRFMPANATFLKRIGAGWTPLMEFKTLNPEQYKYCEWHGALPITSRAPTKQEMLLAQLLQHHEARTIVSQLVLALDKTKTVSTLAAAYEQSEGRQTQLKENYE